MGDGVDRFEYRPLLDGLRALSVSAVVIYHIFPTWLPGGFLGVDVFFVISGFLITTLLLTEHDRSGKIDLAGFWSRRFRRLLPAMMLLLFVVALVEGLLTADVVTRIGRRGDLLSTLFYFVNWHLVITDTSYFAQYLDASPLRHMWSLAIEEQYYAFFPLLMAGGLRGGSRRPLGILLLGIGIASVVAMAVVFNPDDASRAYYGTDTRVFQLLVGAGLAWLTRSGPLRGFKRIVGKATPLALLTLLVFFRYMGAESRFYYQGGALIVAILSAVLIMGLEHESWVRKSLTLKPVVALGIISYGVYLWHWPIYLWINRLGPPDTPGVLLLATVTITLIASVFSYLVVERPIRTKGRLFGIDLTGRRLALAIPISSVLLASFIFFNLGDALPEWASSETQALEVLQPSSTGRTTAPRVHPSSAPPVKAAIDTVTSFAVIGDSVSVSAYQGFRIEANARGWVLVEAAFPACPIGSEPLLGRDKEISIFAEGCAETVMASYQTMIDLQPDLILWHDLQSVFGRLDAFGSKLEPGTQDWTDDLLQEWELRLNSFIEANIPVVILIPPWRSTDASGCEPSDHQQRCEYIQLEDQIIRAATQAFRTLVADRQGVSFIELDSLLCPTGPPCPVTIDGIQIRQKAADQTHFTPEGSIWIAKRWLERALASREAL